MNPSPKINHLVAQITPLRDQLARHELYGLLRDTDDVALFMRHHVFAVWDFMSLLKALQRSITCVDLPWRPVGSARARRFVNEIVLEEESDVIGGVETGHFELYLRAMRQAGADSTAMTRLLDLTGRGVALDRALDDADVPRGAARFVRATFACIGSCAAHVVASAFTFGRESSIATMFENIGEVVRRHPGRLDLLSTYLDRHLQLDGEEHGPKAIALVQDLCGDDERKWQEATLAAITALTERLAFWDSIADALRPRMRAHDMAPHLDLATH